MSDLTAGYPNLFGESSGGEEEGTGEEIEKYKQEAGRKSKLQWLQVIENLSEILKIPFFDVLDLEVEAFLNMISYSIWKNKEIEKKYKKTTK